MINFIKTIVSEEDYQEIKKIGNKYIAHLDPKRVDENTIECYECMLNEEPDIEQLKNLQQNIKSILMNVNKLQLINRECQKLRKIWLIWIT